MKPHASIILGIKTEIVVKCRPPDRHHVGTPDDTHVAEYDDDKARPTSKKVVESGTELLDRESAEDIHCTSP